MRAPVRRRARRGTLAGAVARDDAALLTARKKKLPPHVRDAIARLFSGGAEAVVSERHLEVLRTALLLFAERGYAGASLRELARRLDVAQPSLYHYFATKEQLVEQIIVHLGADLLSSVPNVPPPTGELEDLPRYAIDAVMAVWEGPTYAAFVQFLFVVAVEQPQLREAMHGLYSRGAANVADLLLAPFIATAQIEEAEGRTLIRMAVNSVALLQIEERLLYGRTRASPELRTHARLTAEWLRDAIRHRARR